MSNFTTRTTCMFCHHEGLSPLWEEDFIIPQGCYVVPDQERECHTMPFQVVCCEACRAYQTKYLGDMNVIYDYEANAHGTIRSSMNVRFAEFIGSTGTSILEIGGGNGGLSDIIIEARPGLPYTIVDPTYSGREEGKKIVRSFLEDMPNGVLDGVDTVVMSHVFEHFYEPRKVLEAIRDVKHVFINFPDLESYILEDNYHVLNPEHIFYVENQFITGLLAQYGFQQKRLYHHEKHSVFFEFEKEERTGAEAGEVVTLWNQDSVREVPAFFDRIFERVRGIHDMIEQNPDRTVYIWPCSMHTTYLFALGLDVGRVEAILDNAPHKIGQYLYGFKKRCISFQSVLENEAPCMIILNGGCYNQEIAKNVYKHILFV